MFGTLVPSHVTISSSGGEKTTVTTCDNVFSPPHDFAKSPAACHGENDMTNAEHMGWPWDGCSIKL